MSKAIDRDPPWIMRTYAGHSTAQASNALFRNNLSRGQTGLSVAFDLPTQTGYDADHPMATGEVGKVGVPIGHLGDMDALFKDIPLEQMNTSMTINATAPWLLSLYVALAQQRNVDPSVLRGTTQNDVIKEFLSRGTYVASPAHSLRLTTDVVNYTVRHIPKWNPVNICSYHLQEAGATPAQELAYALVTAMALLDSVKATGHIDTADFGRVVGRISFFVNAGIRFVEELCKMRAFVALWDRLTLERYGVTEAKYRRFRYGVQVNSLGLTEQQPENNIIRIVMEMLAVTLSKDARARAVQLPAWNEALGLPRPWDQQWSLRTQQILAHETDLLEYGDLFNGSPVVEHKVQELMDTAWSEVQEVLKQGGAVAAVENGYIKHQLVQSNARRLRAIEQGVQTVVGVNRFTGGEASPLVSGDQDAILVVDPAVEEQQKAALSQWRSQRNETEVARCIQQLRDTLDSQENIMPASIEAARAGVTTGEWGQALRQCYGEYRAPTGLAGAPKMTTPNPVAPNTTAPTEALQSLRERMDRLADRLGRRPKILVGKPGLDGHSNGAEQIAIKARDVGFDVVYEGIRVTPTQLARSASDEGVHLVGLSILSGSHPILVPEVLRAMKAHNLAHVPVVVGGIIPTQDADLLRSQGVARVYTPKDFQLNHIMEDLISLLEQDPQVTKE